MVDKTLLARDLHSLEGQVAAPPVRSYGSMFILDLGQLKKQPGDERAHGEWCLLFEQAKWAFHKGSDAVVTWVDTPQKIDDKFRSLSLGRVKKASCLGQEGHDLRLEFSNGTVLLAEVKKYPGRQEDDDQWIFFTPVGRTWAAKPAGIELEQD